MKKRLALGAVITAGLMLGGTVRAGDDDAQPLGRYQPKPGGFAGMVQSAATANPAADESANDTELVCHRRRWCCSRGPVFYPMYAPVVVAPRVFYPAPMFAYAPPVYNPTPMYTARFSYFYSGPTPPPWGTTAPPRIPAASPMSLGNPRPLGAESTFRYDGGPGSTVPLPTPDQSGTAPPRINPADEPNAFSVSMTKKPATKPVLKYPAYGEKR